MALTTANLPELPLNTSLPLPSRSSTLNFFFTPSRFSFPPLRPLSSLRTSPHCSDTYSYPWGDQDPKPSPKSNTYSAPWLNRSSSTYSSIQSPDRKANRRFYESELNTEDPLNEAETRYFDQDKGKNAVERIVHRLRNLGLGLDDEVEEEEGNEVEATDAMPVNGKERLGDEMVFPWDRDEKDELEESGLRLKKRKVKLPTMAELTLEEQELRRLRRVGMEVRDRISVPKAGLTQAVLDKIHDKWRKEEVVRLKFHEVLARDMKTAHAIVECRTKGLVIWRSGSLMMVYRGCNYEGPTSRRQCKEIEGDSHFAARVSPGSLLKADDSNATSSMEKSDLVVRNQAWPGNMTAEEAEYNSLINGLGPRFVEWWGTGILPVDADLLPPMVPGYKTPFRLLPTGMRPQLTNAELRRNRNHQGLACAILKLWEKSLVVKIAVKRGIQNTNNKLMADELKNLTGGSLLLRNKYYIVLYRGKDFVPTSVAAVLAERQKLVNQEQDVEEKVRCGSVDAIPSGEDEAIRQAGSLAEFYEAQARWGRDISAEEHEKMIEEAAKAKRIKLVKKIEHKLAVAQAKKLRAERLLAKIEASMVPAGPDYDRETITDEERAMFLMVGLRMKPYLPLGIRGVFDGVIENMHLHWKHRELVKLITKQKTLAFVEDTARLLEYESAGILVAIERVQKGFTLIYYRGKNYRRPITLRPRNLLTKAKALKRSVAMQRHEALSQHITELEKTIEQMNGELSGHEDSDGYDNDGVLDVGEVTMWEDDGSEYPSFKDDGHLMKAV
ncbi:hypothetical protein QN277_012377 [Acacia crassicarpa]|uniref:CRM domain-containing protein n=1 Tax=Acacia crassicarpa TaxID=499986 RepID=A0AAE1TEJ5_9FABA|nr:hypothetical protein QN277_012377 [Acacia crassicarpa]